MKFLGLLAAIIILGMPWATAQESVGKAVVDGKVVVLYSDGTWQYESGEAGCSPIAKGITVCPGNEGWMKASNASADAAATFRLDDRNYAMIIDEKLGVADGLNKEFMTKAVITNVAIGANIPESEVLTMNIEDGQLFGRDKRTITYGAPIDGLDVVYVNSVVFSENRTLQILTYSIGKVFTDEMGANHQSFISTIKVE